MRKAFAADECVILHFEQEKHMRHRTDIITAPIGWGRLSVRREIIDGKLAFQGCVDERACVSALTFEAAAQALLRRVLHKMRL